MDSKEYLDSKELAEKLGVSLKFIQKHTASRRLPGIIKVGKLVRFSKNEVEKRLAGGALLIKK